MSNQKPKAIVAEKEDKGPWKLEQDFLPKLRSTLMKLVYDKLVANLQQSVILAARLKMDRNQFVLAASKAWENWEQAGSKVPNDSLQQSIDLPKPKS